MLYFNLQLLFITYFVGRVSFFVILNKTTIHVYRDYVSQVVQVISNDYIMIIIITVIVIITIIIIPKIGSNNNNNNNNNNNYKTIKQKL